MVAQAVQTADAVVRTFDPKRVRPFPGQPRKRFWGINRLAASIKQIGQTTAGIVTLVDDDPNFDAQLIDGERRLRACDVAKVLFRAEVRPKDQVGNLDEQFAHSIAANFQKQDHDVVEIMEAIEKLRKQGKTLQEIANIFGKKSVGWVTQHLSLLKLDSRVLALMVPHSDDDVDDIIVTDEEIPDEPRRSRLTLQLGLLLVPFPQELQFPLASKIIDMTFAEARRTVLKAKRGAGIKNESSRSPFDQFDSLHMLVITMADKLGVFVDMEGHEFNSILGSVGITDRTKLVKAMTTLRDNIDMLADSVRDYKQPKTTARVAV